MSSQIILDSTPNSPYPPQTGSMAIQVDPSTGRVVTVAPSGVKTPIGTTQEDVVGFLAAAPAASRDALGLSHEAKVWLLPYFETTSETLHIAASANGVNFTNFGTRLFNGINSTVRDPSFFYRDGWWYLSYTPNSFSASQSLYIARSRDLLTWENYTTIDFSSVGGASMRIWSPDWFEDEDGSVHIVVACNPDYSPVEDFAIYRVTANSASLDSWSAPALMFDAYQSIDPFLFKDSGTYYLAYKNEASGQKYIELASSATIDGTYTRIKSGNWMGMGSGIEGASFHKRAEGDWLFYADKYATNSGLGLATSTSLLSGWGALTPLSTVATGTLTIRHGTPFLVKDFKQLQGAFSSLLARGVPDIRSYPTGRSQWVDVPVTAGSDNLVQILSGDKNANNTGIGIGFIPDIGSTPLAEIVARRTSLATGATSFIFKSWDGAANAVRLTISGLGHIVPANVPTKADDAAADADTTIPSGAFYRTTAGGRTVFRKP